MAPRIPRWAEDIDELQDYITDAHGLATNIPKTASAGQDVHVGIIDSACELPEDLTAEHIVHEGDSNSFVSTSDTNTIPHCRFVFNRVSAYAPMAEFSLYQAVNEDRDLTLGAFSDAVTQAIEDEVDLVNISAGDPWPGPIDLNPCIPEVRRLIDAGISVVAAAGNYYPERQHKKPPVHCPSAAEEVISVGAFISECPHEPGREPTERRAGPYFCIPETEEVREAGCLGTYCGEQGCVDGKSCITNQSDSSWDRNVLPTGGKPDALAPMHILQGDNDGDWVIKGGSSFAVPLVTGSLACVFSELRDLGKEVPPPYVVRNAVRNGVTSMKGNQIGKYDAMGVRDVLSVT